MNKSLERDMYIENKNIRLGITDTLSTPPPLPAATLFPRDLNPHPVDKVARVRALHASPELGHNFGHRSLHCDTGTHTYAAMSAFYPSLRSVDLHKTRNVVQWHVKPNSRYYCTLRPLMCMPVGQNILLRPLYIVYISYSHDICLYYMQSNP